MKHFIFLIFLKRNSSRGKACLAPTALIIHTAICLILFVPQRVSAQIELFHQVDTAKKCSICHYRWIQTFYVEHRGTPLAPLNEEEVVGSQKMCLSCHDGSVRDSRDKICNDPGHRVGTIPSKRVAIPDKFPLDKNGALLCATCHTPHATTKYAEARVEFFLRAPNINSSFCRMCHINKTGGVNKGNHPVDILPKNDTSELIKAGGRLGTKPKNHIICETCHIPHGGVNNKFLVLSAEDPKTRSVLCEVCHTRKPGLANELSLNEFSHPLDLTPGEKTVVPLKWQNGGHVVLGTGGELVCRTCHIPHGAADQKTLLVDPNHKDSLCAQCHRNKSKISESSHYIKVLDKNEKNIKGQPVSDLGPCSPCHLAHQGTGDLMWARKIKNEAVKPGEVCLNCHCSNGSAKNIMPGKFSHPMNVTSPGRIASLPLPLFDENGISLKGKIRCSTCHDFHNPFPLYDDPVSKEIKHAKFIRRLKNDASDICAVCHSSQSLIIGTNHDLNVTAPEFINNYGQGPAQAGVCSPCHVIHNKNPQKYLWSAPKGPTLVKGWDQAQTTEKDIMTMLCTGCHSPGRTAQNHVPEFGLHPREKLVEGKPISSFETDIDEFPIFSDAGEITENGNIVCSTCHNPHQWDPRLEENGAGKEVEGDVTNSFLRPGLLSMFCTACHGKDGLIKFTYFHSRKGRVKEKAPFSIK